MSTQEERKINDQKVNVILKEAAGDDQDALEYLHLIAASARIVDDIKDEPESVNSEQLLTLVEMLCVLIPANKFFQTYQKELFSQHLIIWNTWKASNELEKGDETDKIYAHVLRDYINELVPLVAFLTQGYYKMKVTNDLIRVLFKKKLGE